MHARRELKPLARQRRAEVLARSATRVYHISQNRLHETHKAGIMETHMFRHAAFIFTRHVQRHSRSQRLSILREPLPAEADVAVYVTDG